MPPTPNVDTLQLIIKQLEYLSTRLDGLGEGFTGSDRKTLITCEVQTSNLLQSHNVLAERIRTLESGRVSRTDIEDLQDQVNHIRDYGEEAAKESEQMLGAIRQVEATLRTLHTALEKVESTINQKEKETLEREKIRETKLEKEASRVIARITRLESVKLQMLTALAVLGGVVTAIIKFGPALLRWVGIISEKP